MGGHPDVNFIEELVKREAGIVLPPDKGYLLETRLLPVAYKHGLDGLPAMASRLRAANDPELLREVVEAMAAGDTCFFRDYTPFEKFRTEILPGMIMTRAGMKRLRIWSAACATGQEPYSIAMLLLESGLVLSDWKIEVLATDISQEAIGYARAAAYTQLEVQRGLPARYLVRYFAQEGQRWRLQPEVAERVQFSPLNLVSGFGEISACDIILCRYALQNFDAPMQAKVLKSLKAALAPDGVLFLGLGEDPLGLFTPIDPALGIFGNQNTP